MTAKDGTERGRPKWSPPFDELDFAEHAIGKGGSVWSVTQSIGIPSSTWGKYYKLWQDGEQLPTENGIAQFVEALARAEGKRVMESEWRSQEEGLEPSELQRLLRLNKQYHTPRQGGKVTMQDNDGRKVTAEWGDLDSMSDEELARAYQAATTD